MVGVCPGGVAVGVDFVDNGELSGYQGCPRESG